MSIPGSRRAAEDKCVEELHRLFISLLGAIAYASHTRVDCVVFIVALQRQGHCPLVQHVRRLNKLLRWAQRFPKKPTYKRMTLSQGSHLKVVSDAAFKKETEKGHCLRGVLYLRAPGSRTEDFKASLQTTTVHVLEWVCKNQRHVNRSTFSAELLSAGDAVDQGLLLSQVLHEIENGPMSAVEARNQRNTGNFKTPMVLYIDAMSVFAAVTAVFVKTPAEKSLLCHVQFLRELLDHGVLAAIVWLDTRDMFSDGLTKGAVPRDAPLQVMEVSTDSHRNPRFGGRRCSASAMTTGWHRQSERSRGMPIG